jgi:serine/threonine protein kinase/tetratricopeptide (TPR) repeat protein
MTTPQRWQEIDRIFAEALAREPSERESFLDEACAEDEELRNEVESLIAHDVPASFVEGGAVEEATRLLARGAPRVLTGERIGPYLISESIGAGGMGEVYLATDKLGRKVALKVLAARLITDQQHVARFLQEARTVLALNHPNIVTIYDIGETEGAYYIASELIEGETLRHRLETDEFELRAVLEISIQVATALTAAHEKGIVHRDIKPENVMIRSDGYLKVLDFGIAKLTEDFQGPVSTEAPTRQKIETAEGVVIGTASYMSPEQARGLKVDARTDIWSFGAMLYEMLAGKVPFAGGTAAEIVAGILEREPTPLARYVTDPPAELQRIVNKALMKNRDERYQTIKDLLLDLRALKQELEFGSRLARSITPSEESGAPSASELATPQSFSVASTAADARDFSASTHPVSSAEYVVKEIKQHKKGAIALASLVVALLLIVGFSIEYFRQPIVAKTSIESIAVLPFENVTHDENTEYLSDGVTESLINSLSQLPNIKVIGRNSVFSYKGQTPKVQEIARQLNVRAVLTGRVLMQGDTIDVRAELTDAQFNTQLWGDHYTRKVADIFAVQDEIARQVTDTLRVRLTGGQQEQVTKRYTENAEAYRLYMQGRYYENQGSEEDNSRAISLFTQAIGLDPHYALAYAARGQTFFDMGDISLSMNAAKQKVEQDIGAALGIDNKLIEARLTRANLEFQYDWDFPRAEDDFKQIISSNPNYAEAHHEYMYLLAMTGRPMEAEAEVKLAQQLDPVNPGIVVDSSLPFFLARQYDQSIAEVRKAVEMFPSFFLPHMALGSALSEKGDTSAGIEELEKAKAMEPSPHVKGSLGYAYAKSGRRDEARKLATELKDESRTRYIPAYYIALIYAGLGERDEAFSWLEKAYQDRSWWLVWIKMDPRMDSLRSDQRFTDLLRRIGFPQ